MKVQTELEAKREATDHFIQDNAISIPLTRHDRTRTPSGGYSDTERVLLAQDFRITGAPGLTGAESRVNIGEVTSYGVQIVGYWDADIQDGDTFILNGGRYKITFVYPERSYRTIADAIYQGAPQ